MAISSCTAALANRSLLVDLLSILFAIGSWICVNGLWVELPLLVQELPEGWTLPSYLSFIITISNVAPISYSIFNYCWPRVVTEKRGIYCTAVIGTVSTFLLALFWDRTSYFWGQKRSTALLSLVFFFGMVDCSSRVLYVPFMSIFHEQYLTSFFIGEGLSALVPSLFALVQGVGGVECRLVNQSQSASPAAAGTGTANKYEQFLKPPIFSVELFFYVLLGLVVVSALAFHLLNYESIVKDALATTTPKTEPPGGKLNLNTTVKFNSDSETTDISSAADTTTTTNTERSSIAAADKDLDSSPLTSLFAYAVIVQLIVCFTSNGIFPSIQSFSSLPYGIVPYHLVVTLSTMINPTVCFLFFALPKPTVRSINWISGLVTIVSAYVMATAVLSPEPPWRGQFIGEFLLVFTWVLMMGFYTYIKVALATILRCSHGKRGLFWFGAITQIGSATGSVCTFLVVNFTNVFHSYDACSGQE